MKTAFPKQILKMDANSSMVTMAFFDGRQMTRRGIEGYSLDNNMFKEVSLLATDNKQLYNFVSKLSQGIESSGSDNAESSWRSFKIKLFIS